MKRAVKKLLVVTSIAAGMGGIFTAPALAGSLTNSTIVGSQVKIGGSAADDYYVYDSNDDNTFKVDSTQANVQRVLYGNADDTRGNVELASGSEGNGFDFTKNTTLEGEVGGQDIILSSLTEDDWARDMGGGMTFGQSWFNEVLMANGFNSLVGNDSIFNIFKFQGGFQRFSDPNISYVNQDSSGDINIGLAGHFDATDLLVKALNPWGEQGANQFEIFLNRLRNPSERGKAIQASEVVKVTYGGETEYLYSFKATETGLTDIDDGFSHNGNYQVTFTSAPDFSRARKVPEPSVMLGLLSVAGIFVSKRRENKA